MKKIFIFNESSQKLGGGFSFINNFIKGIQGKAEIVDTWQKADAVLIPSSSMVANTKSLHDMKLHKKKILFRVDNMPRNSRNKNTGSSRLSNCAKLANCIIFQSNWAKSFIGGWLEFAHEVNLKHSKVIYNGVDTEFFYYKDDPKTRGETYLYTTFNTDESKNWLVAAYDFYKINMKARKEKTEIPRLKLVGNFSSNLVQYGFDFFNEEKYEYLPPIEDRKKMGDIYRSCKYMYAPYYNDACSNTVAEAISCGCTILLTDGSGGTPEVIELFDRKTYTIQDMADEYLELV